MDKKPPFNFERKIQKFWEKEKIFKFEPRKKGEIFSIDTPPPTLSGRMHLGHAFSYTHQDIIARYHRLRGKNVFYPFGTDDNGLATERLVEKENKVRIFDMSREDFVKLCQRTIKKLTPEFIQDWKDIGISCDFSLNYSTISPEVQKISQHYFIDLYKKKRIYRKQAPVLWCPECQTAIAQAELEDRELESYFNDIIFKLEKGKKIIIATTRPELLSSCVAIFVHPKDKRYKKIVGKTAIVPLFGQKVKILKDKRVDPDKGTGVVMCCTFGDATDIEWYLTHNLDLRVSLAKDGRMTELAGSYQGLKIKEARRRIIEDLANENLLVNQKKIKHIVNVHERCGTEIEILPTTQWFIRYLDLKKDFLEYGRKIRWLPKHMRIRYENWIRGLQWDWCISRQRYFGIPIPVWYCQKCERVILARESQLPVDPIYSQPKQKCPCGSKEFIPEKDVLDTWATSALTPQIAQSLVKSREIRRKLFPMTLRPQAHDIINFWLFYTVVRSRLHFKKIPWKNVMISGFVLDPKGEKMSKSKGNVVAPQTVISKFGADALRYWATGGNLGEDLRYNEEELKIGQRTVTKLWNSARFCFFHFQQAKRTDFRIKTKNLEPSDWWILTKLEEAVREYCRHLDNYNYFQSRRIVDRFFWHDFCDNYLEIVKYRLYEKENSESYQAGIATLYHCLLTILKLYAPYLPFITEEIYQQIFRKKEKSKSVHITLLKENPKLKKTKVKEEFEEIISLISALRKYKSEKKISLRAEIPKLIIDAKKIKIEKYLRVIQKTMNIKEIILGPARKKITSNIWIYIKD